MANDLAKLNRLRLNAGKPELKSWKASQDKLDAAVKVLEEAGHTDALPGADVNAKPETTDPEVAANLVEPEKPVKLEDSAMAKNIANPPKDEKPKEKPKAGLARGLDTDTMARNSRLSVRMIREKEQAEAKAARKAERDAEKADKKKPKKEGKIVGEVDAKKEPEKAQRQKDKIKAKQEARAAKPKAEKNPNEITVADIARELDIDPKVARAKLRRHEAKLEKLHTKGQDRWTFPKSAAKDIKSILTGGK